MTMFDLRQGWFRRTLALTVCLLVLTSVTSGCEPLRKKFTRKKKVQAADDFIPVLQPENYSAPSYTPQDRYQQHIALWRVWYKDLWSAITENDSDKRQRYTLLEATAQLERMAGLIKGDKQERLQAIIAELKNIGRELDAPRAMRNVSSILAKLQSLDREIRSDFQSEAVKDSF